jgi:outer membrane protein insertion porin family
MIQRDVDYKGSCLLVGFVALLIGSCFCSAYGASDSLAAENLPISSIETAGNVTISRSEVLALTRAKVGQIFHQISADEDASRIAEIEGVEYAYYNTEVVDEQVQLIYVVVEKNIVRDISFQGNEKYKERRLLKEIGFKRGDYLDVFRVRNGVKTITELYHKAGYSFAEILVDERKIPEGEVTYVITEGERVKVKSVTFEGNTSFSSKDLTKAIEMRKKKFLFFPVYFNTEKLTEDIDKVQAVYHKRGYMNASVEAVTKFSDDKDGVSITFEIHEGPIYVVSQINISGNTFIDTTSLSSEMKLVEGDVYSEERGEFDKRKISGKYLEKGYINVQVLFERSFAGSGEIVVDFKIVEGERFRIGEIVVTGNEKTYDKVVRRILDEEGFRPGQWYDADAARGDGQGDLEKDLRQTVMTESAFIRPVGTAAYHRDAHVNIVEGQTGSIMLGAGVASNEGLIGQLVYDQRNFDIMDWPKNAKEMFTGKAFRGAGQHFRIALEPGTEQSRVYVMLSEPDHYYNPGGGVVLASKYERGREAYNEERMKGYFGFEKRYPDKWRRGVSFRAETVNVVDLEFDAPQEIIDVKGGNDMFGVKVFVRKDTTNSRYYPSEGYNFNASYEQVGGDHIFGSLSATQRWYKTLHEDLAERKTILETKFQASTIIGDAPPFEKFYAGGTGSVRGFDYRGVSTRGWTTSGPREQNDPIGSDWMLLANAEVAIPLATDVFSALFFVDAGMIDTGGVRVSIGTGLQIMLPQWFGPVPMRFEIAVPIAKDDLDETQVFSFSIGALF